MSYHHGNLRAALVDVAVDLARSGGPDAVTIRAVTRAAGVSPAAAYRHFADQRELAVAAGDVATIRLADAMLAAQGLFGGADGDEIALNRLRGVGVGYITFALDEPGWFALAFATQPIPGPQAPVDVLREGGRARPFALLVESLDGLVTAGVITVTQRENAEWACWSTVHGFADLAGSGPLSGQDRAVIDVLALEVAETIITGLRAR